MLDKFPVSIIIPAYNAERFIAETIQSVVHQTYTNWELLIIDDGSKDNTAQIVKSFLNDNRIKYFFQKNSGVSAARNLGMSYSSGNYLAFLDADDLWEKENLEKKIKFLDSNPDSGMVISYMQIIIGDVEKKGAILQGMEGEVLDPLLLWEESSQTAPSNMLVRKEVMAEVGCWDTELSTAADQELFFRIASKYKIGRIDQVLTNYRVHKKNMHSNIKLLERDHILAYKKAYSNRLFRSFWFKQKCFSNMYIILAGCWWKDAHNKTKGLLFIFRALLIYPPSIIKLLRKFFT